MFSENLMQTYASSKLSFEKGSGTWLFTKSGEAYLDFASGIAVNILGHGHPHLVSEIQLQASKLLHTSNLYNIEQQQRLAKRLCNLSFAEKVFFCNSGAEANEGAIKVARRYFYSIGKPNKYRIICIKNSFHGRTIAAISASGSKKMTEGFGPKSPGFDHFEFGNHKKMKKLINKNTAAIMVETIMGEGGIKVIPNWCIKELRKICNKKGILLILDEVQCGVGRSGKFFAFEDAKIKPDIVPIAKGIGGGFPIGAVLMSKKVAKGMTPGTHGSTFGGNPLAMSVGNAVLDQILNKGFLPKVRKLSNYFHSELNKIQKQFPSIIKEVRGVGYLIGLQLLFDQTKFIQQLMDNKLLTIRAAENVIRILPPLNVKKSEIDIALSIIKKVCFNYKI